MDPGRQPEHRRLFTIGHGNAPFTEIERLLRIHGVAMLIDVRSNPYSRFSPDFRQRTLTNLTAAAGIGYRWMGDRLGGRITYEPDGGADVGPGAPSFESALADVLTLNQGGPVALLCAERNPDHCHRSALLAPALEALGAEVYHILEDGSARRHQPTLGL